MSELEKESLEAHVDLCSERYNGLHRELKNLSSRMDKFEQTRLICGLWHSALYVTGSVTDKYYMRFSELTEGMAWAKRGNKVVRKFRCTSGKRKSRVVSSPAQCFAAPDIKKRIKLKMTKARLGARMVRKAKKTKRINPASKRVAALNKASR